MWGGRTQTFARLPRLIFSEGRVVYCLFHKFTLVFSEKSFSVELPSLPRLYVTTHVLSSLPGVS